MAKLKQRHIAKKLKVLAKILEMEGRSDEAQQFLAGFRCLRDYDFQLYKLYYHHLLDSVAGITPLVKQTIRELLETGSAKIWEKQMDPYPPFLPTLLESTTMSAARAKQIIERHQLKNYADLLHVCQTHGISQIPGFGLKTELELAQLAQRKLSENRLYFYHEAILVLADLTDFAHSKNLTFDTCGALARRIPFFDDITLVAPQSQQNQWLDLLQQHPLITTQSKPDAIAFMWAKTPIQLSFLDDHSWGTQLLWKRGNPLFLEALQHFCALQQMELTPQGIKTPHQLHSFPDEASLFQFLNLPYIPPYLREDARPFLQESVDNSIAFADLQGTFHFHTVESDGRDLLENYILQAMKQGWSYLGIADHSAAAGGVHGVDFAAAQQQKQELVALQKKYPEIQLFYGIEAEILPDGNLEFTAEELFFFDFVIAAPHNIHHRHIDDPTEWLCRAMRNPFVTMLAHPSGRRLPYKQGLNLDYEQLFATAAQYNIIIEFNCSPSRIDLDWRHIRSAVDHGLLISINPDAHEIEELDSFLQSGIAVLQKAQPPKTQIFNTFSTKQIIHHFQQQKNHSGRGSL